jgi:hypothetical protein
VPQEPSKTRRQRGTRWLTRRRRSSCSAVCATRCDDWRCLQSSPPRSSESTRQAESKGDPVWRHTTAGTSLRAKGRSRPRSRARLTSDKRTTGSHLLRVRPKREWTANREPLKRQSACGVLIGSILLLVCQAGASNASRVHRERHCPSARPGLFIRAFVFKPKRWILASRGQSSTATC